MAMFKTDDIIVSKDSRLVKPNRYQITDVYDDTLQYEIYDFQTGIVSLYDMSTTESVCEIEKRIALDNVSLKGLKAGWGSAWVGWDLAAPAKSLHQEQPVTCSHPNKYINHIFTSRFWVCPDCKKDLGNV